MRPVINDNVAITRIVAISFSPSSFSFIIGNSIIFFFYSRYPLHLTTFFPSLPFTCLYCYPPSFSPPHSWQYCLHKLLYPLNHHHLPQQQKVKALSSSKRRNINQYHHYPYHRQYASHPPSLNYLHHLPGLK